MRRRDLDKIAMEAEAVERLLRFFRANGPATATRRAVREALFGDTPGLSEASFVRVWNEARRRSALGRDGERDAG